MTQHQEDLTRTLASALWRSALSPCSRALDDWLAAEQMVAEALEAARSAPKAATEAAAAPVRSLPSPAFPVEYVRALAQCFWEHSARSAALTLDIWLAAERHVHAFCRAALGDQGVEQPFSAGAYWRRIRDHAEWLWHVEGRPGDRDLDTWLRAEDEVREQVAAGGDAASTQPRRDMDGPRRRPLALTILDEAGESALAPWQARSANEHGGAHPSL